MLSTTRCFFNLLHDSACVSRRYTEEEQSAEAIAYLARMSDSLRTLYTPPRVLELPPQAPSATSDLVAIGLSLLRAGAIYAPDPPVSHAGERGDPFCGGMAPRSASPETEAERVAAAAAACTPAGGGCCAPSSKCVACQARSAAAEYCARHGGATGSEGEGTAEEGDEPAAVARQQSGAVAATAESAKVGVRKEGGEPDREKALRAKVASCLSALKSARREQEAFSEELEQAHIQVRNNKIDGTECLMLAAGGGGGIGVGRTCIVRVQRGW